MPSTIERYPRWYGTVRGSIFGVAGGIYLTIFLYESGTWQAGSLWMRFGPLLFGGAPMFVLGVFELSFEARRFIAVRRDIRRRSMLEFPHGAESKGDAQN